MAFSDAMTTPQLMAWLEARGLGSEDRQRLRDEEFIGETFRLLDKELIDELRIENVDCLEQLLEEVKLGGDDAGCDGSDGEYNNSSVPLFCSVAPYSDLTAACSGANPGAGAAVYKKHLWDIKCLKVHFLNPEILVNWTFEKKPITKAMILEWANVWNPGKKESIPQFVEIDDIRRAQIRIRFSDKGTCWSMVGKCAERVKMPDPTMFLNLSKDHRQSDAEKRSLVIHEFGHALGLGHEHERSDFWEKVGVYFDKETIETEMDVDHRRHSDGKKATFEKDYFEATDGLCKSSEYDPTSIMHYEFRFDWLKKDIRSKINNSVRHAFTYDGFSAEVRKIFKIIFKKKSLSVNPSKTDIRCLEEVYALK